MNTSIEIHDNKSNETGTYKVWFYYPLLGGKCVKVLSIQDVDSLLDMRQKELFFIGKFKFKVKSEFDFKKTFFNTVTTN